MSDMQYNEGYPIYEVQKFGVTVEFTSRFSHAETAFKWVSPGNVVMYSIDITGKKYPMKSK